MTRINCVPVTELTNKHLLAEYRELPRIFKLARPSAKIPASYRMGAGHVTFFYDKLLWCQKRQRQLIAECLRRGFNIQYTSADFNIAPGLGNDWQPDAAAIAINRARISERLTGVK